MRNILVTGGNQGIGFSLCKQLVTEHNCHVILTARNVKRGQAAASKIESAVTPSSSGSIEFIPLDTSDISSIKKCKEETSDKLNGESLYGIVNNAGIGLNTGSGDIIQTNLYGPKHVSEEFLDLLDPNEGRIVNLGSGSGPMYVGGCNIEDKRILCGPSDENSKVTWEYIEEYAKKNAGGNDYGLSKALLASYTAWFARKYPNITTSCVSPGFIDTQMTRGWGASKSPDQATLAIKKCLLDDLDGANGWYYGSDGLRSPYHFMRNPGEPIYDGVNPFL
mmetsp:Transcript_11229/g.12859  ORF Transcript_11229/g.12859 Transcript_11229/m.12859 type:complete len:278 (-) Transcript_11229:20-853(-)